LKKLKRILKWTAIVGLVLLTLLVILLHLADFSIGREEAIERFKAAGASPEFKSVEFADYSVHYVAVGDTANPTVLFVHGSPGVWDNFIDQMTDPELLKSFRMIAIDRPGFGNTNPGSPERSIAVQAEVIAEVLKAENETAILAGHSYAGPVIVKAAIDHSELVNGLLLLAASVDPDLEETLWIQIPFHYKAFSWLLPGDLYSSNEEILALKQELANMNSEWDQIEVPVSIIQGTNDRLVPMENAYFAERKLRNTPATLIMVEGMDHFIPWTNPELITEELIRLEKERE
jgi:pimeloyl-ACP methyl ester carboxylesterase